jgi:hypothetical protein
MPSSLRNVRISFTHADPESLLKIIQYAHGLGKPLDLRYNWTGAGYILVKTRRTYKALDRIFRDRIDPAALVGILDEPEENGHDHRETA